MKTFLLSLMGGIVGAILFNVLHLAFYGTQQGVVRLDELLTEHVASIGKAGHSEEEMKMLSSRYAEALEAVMANYAKQRITLFVDQAVVSELPDYTGQIRDSLQQHLQHPAR